MRTGAFQKIKDKHGAGRVTQSLRLAAPDLLQALEAICDLPPDDSGERTIPPGFLDDARAAIAKARGAER